jgi:6-phosphogluconate dehydrogenase
LRFSREREKRVKISHPILFMKKAGRSIKGKLNAVNSTLDRNDILCG